MDRVGIVILNFGTPRETCDLVKKICEFRKLQEIVIVDNPAEDESAEYIKQFVNSINSDKITFIEAKENGGYARGNNIGLRELVEKMRCEICFISNPDVSFEERDFDEILRCFDAYSTYGVLTCTRRVDDGSRLRQYWNLPTYKDILGDKFFLFRDKNRKNEVYEINSLETVIKIPIAPGAFWAARSELLKQVNYLDENTFLFYEENCFARKIEHTGMKIGLVTGSEYCVLAGKASTDEMKKNGTMMKFLLDSQRHYVKEYLHISGFKLFIYDLLCKYNAIELKVNKIRKRGKR